MQVSVLSKLRVTGAIALENTANTFPANPSLGSMTIKDDMLFAYLTLGDVVNWYPLVRLPERYVHSQTSPSSQWTVSHNLNKQDVWYQVQDSNGQLTFASEFTEIDANTFTLTFAEAVQGKVLVLGTGLDGDLPANPDAPQTVTISSIADWPAGVSAQELGYLDGLRSSIQSQIDAAATTIADHTAAIAANASSISATDGRVTQEISDRQAADASLAQQIADISTAPQTLENKTISEPVIVGAITESVYAITGTAPSINPSNGTIQTWTLTGNSAPTFSMENGQSLTVMIADGTNYTIAWPAATSWVGGSAPTLATSGQSVLVFWKVDSIIYGSRVGDV